MSFVNPAQAVTGPLLSILEEGPDFSNTDIRGGTSARQKAHMWIDNFYNTSVLDIKTD
jgi:hypothetical protein